MKASTSILALVAAAGLFAACAKKADSAAAGPSPTDKIQMDTKQAEPPMPDINYADLAAAVLSDPARPEADRTDDERRNPAAALEFFQIAPSMKVFEIEAGGGWYTEILSRAVGPTGSVVMQGPEGFLAFYGEQVTARLADNRLPNVRQSLSNFDALDAVDASIDLVTWVQGPHELYFKPSEGVSLGDPAKSYAEIFRILRPGAAFVVIDHSAVAGAPEATGNDLHRIDRAIVVEMAEAAGFALEAESDFLANPEDARKLAVFDPAIRGNTDQFALRFRKPRG